MVSIQSGGGGGLDQFGCAAVGRGRQVGAETETETETSPAGATFDLPPSERYKIAIFADCKLLALA